MHVCVSFLSFSFAYSIPLFTPSLPPSTTAVCCAERGLSSHLLLRGEPPPSLTGNALVSAMFGSPRFTPRHVYAQRDAMLASAAVEVAGKEGRVVFPCCPLALPPAAAEGREDNVGGIAEGRGACGLQGCAL